jgi:hypothetical protein
MKSQASTSQAAVKRLPIVDGSFNFWDRMSEQEKQEWLGNDMAEAEMYNMEYDLLGAWVKYEGAVRALSEKPALTMESIRAGEILQELKRDVFMVILGEEENQAVDRLLEGLEMWKGNDGSGAYLVAVSVEKLQLAIDWRREASLERACDRAASFGLSVEPVDTNSGRYSGKLVSSSELHLIQDVGRGSAVIHYRGDVDSVVLVVGQNRAIQYDGGKAHVVDRVIDTKRER